MGRYVQQISLVPFSTAEMWVGWELEGVEGDVEGLVAASTLTSAELARLGICDFQYIPAEYANDVQLDIRRSFDPKRNSGSDRGPTDVMRARGNNVSRSNPFRTES